MQEMAQNRHIVNRCEVQKIYSGIESRWSGVSRAVLSVEAVDNSVSKEPDYESLVSFRLKHRKWCEPNES